MAVSVQPDALPAEGGAYVLLVRLLRPVPLGFGNVSGAVLPAGLYAYCGSAYGPGGIRARVARHLRHGKTMRWHVDRLTAAGRVEDVVVRIGGRECELVDELLDRGCRAAVPGFGSSDCRWCPAHLVTVPDGLGISVLPASA